MKHKLKTHTLKKGFLIGSLVTSCLIYSQVGINTANPTATLDVTAKNSTGTTTNVDVLLVPRVDRQRAQSMTGIPTSTLIYVNSIATGTQTGSAANIDTTGYYYFDAGVWTKLKTPAGTPTADINIYNNDGTLAGDRNVGLAGHNLGFTGAGNVGIGTVSPTSKLHLIGNALFNVAGNAPASHNALDINIGQDNLFWGNRAENFGLNISSTLAGDVGSVARLNFGDINTAGISGNGTKYLSFSVGRPLTELMYLTNQSNGKVGIGTTAPAERLTVVDSGNLNQYQGTASFMANNLTWGVGIGYNGIQSIGTNTNNSLSLNAKGTGGIIMQTNGTTGNVGIGTTAPANKLEVNSAIADISGIRMTQLTSTGSAGISTAFLGVNANGDIVRARTPLMPGTPGGTAGVGGQITSIAAPGKGALILFSGRSSCIAADFSLVLHMDASGNILLCHNQGD